MNKNELINYPQSFPQKQKYDKIFMDQRSGKYPIINGTFTLGDLRSSVVVLLPTPDHSLEMLSINHGAAIAGSANTSSMGIECIIANTISNPNIRNIIVFGEDGPSFRPGQSLINLKEYGVDEQGFILKSDDRWGARILHLEKTEIDRFREQILNVVDLLGEDDSVLLTKIVDACIQEPENAKRLTTSKGKSYLLYDPGPLNQEPLYPRIDVGKPGGFFDKTFDPFSSFIIAEDISQAYSLLWSNVRSQGSKVPSQFGPTLELLNCTVHIKNPLKNYLSLAGDKSKTDDGGRLSNYMFEDCPISQRSLQDFLEKYFETLMSAEKMKVFFDKSTGNYEIKENPEAKYTYGERIRAYKFRDKNGNAKTRDNLEMVIQALTNAIENNANTRRCMISLINPVFDLTVNLEDVDPPCITTMFFNPRWIEQTNWLIHGTMVMRSHDVRRAFVANAYAFSKLTEYVCSQIKKNLPENINVGVGSITIFFVSAHEYID